MKDIMRIAVCDDHAHDSQLVVSLIEKYLDLHHHVAQIDVFNNGEDFLAQETDKYLLVFMDIYMTGINGMETAKTLYKDNRRTKIVFCSTTSDFGVESYDVNALGYLLKPVDETKIFSILDRFYKIYTSLKSIVVKVNRMDEQIYLNDVIWVEANRNQCIIHTKKKDIVTRCSFTQLCEQFSSSDFVKPIRYALVSLKEVVKVPSDVFVLSNGEEVPIAKDNRTLMKDSYMDFLWRQSFSGNRGA